MKLASAGRPLCSFSWVRVVLLVEKDQLLVSLSFRTMSFSQVPGDFDHLPDRGKRSGGVVVGTICGEVVHVFTVGSIRQLGDDFHGPAMHQQG